MKSYRLGNRTHNPVFFDMSSRFRPAGAAWYGHGFRLGDRAGAFVILSDWRAHNPHIKLTVVEDNFLPGCTHSRRFNAQWMFAGIADEVQAAAQAHDHINRPPGDNLYKERLWRSWARLMQSDRSFCPNILPDRASCDVVQHLTAHLRIPPVYITVQPLWDARYDRHRNQGPRWWEELIRLLAQKIAVVVIGDVSNASTITLPGNAFPAWRHGLNAMDSLEFIHKAAWHVGGETGLTLWSPIIKTPTIALYRTWQRRPGHLDTRPMGFGAPIVRVPLGDSPDVVAELICQAYTSPNAVSTPL